MLIIKNILYKIYFLFILYICSFSLFAQTGAQGAQGTAGSEGVGQFLVNLSVIYPQLFTFLNGFTIVVGVVFIMLAFFKLKHLADFRNMMQGQQEVGKSITLIMIGVIFLWMPFVLNAFTYTFYGMSIGAVQSKYADAGGVSGTQQALFQLLQAIGIISFIRGWFILSTVSKGGTQPGTMGKAITHIISGLLLFHARATMKIIENTLGVPIIT